MRRSRFLLQSLSAACLLIATLCCNSVLAQDKPVRILVGLPPGGAVDLVARLLAEKLREPAAFGTPGTTGTMGTTVIVENRPGAQTRIAVQALKAAAPDGSTLLVSPGAIVTLYPHMFRQLGYEPFKDLAPVAMLAVSEYGIAVPAESPAKTLAQFIDWAKANPRLASYATPSTGSPQHFLGILLGNITGAKLEPIGFKGAAEAVTALIGNQLPAAILSLGELVPGQQSGKLRVLATFGEARAALLPEVPTIREAGFAELQSSGWFALFAPGGTPQPVIDKLNKAVAQALADPAVRERIARTGLIPRASTARELDDLNHREFTRWQGPVKASGYVAD